MTFDIKSIEFFDLGDFSDGPLSAADLAQISSLFLDYKNLGVNTVSIGWGVPVDEKTGNIVSAFSVPGIHAASLSEIQAISNVASKLGLGIILKPQAQTRDAIGSNGSLPDNVYSSDVGSGFNANMFLSQWATYMGSVGSLAHQVGASMVVVGTENGGFDTTAYRSQWINVINDTRQSYNGNLTYASSSDPSAVSFWDKLNIIGVDAYFSLTSNLNPAYSDVLSGWSSNTTLSTASTLGGGNSPVNIVAKLQELSAQYNEPLYFSEFGGQSFHGVVNNPSGAGPNNPVADWQQQEWLYQSMFQAISQNNSSQWFRGTNLWSVYPGTPPENSSEFVSYLANFPTSFDVRGKPAGLVVASWFGAKDYLSSTQVSFTGSIANDEICLYGAQFASAVGAASDQPISQSKTFSTVISITLDGTILNGQSPTVHFFINNIDEGAQTLQNAPGSYVDARDVPWSADQTFTFTLPGLSNINQLKVAIDSPVNLNGAENSQTFIASASINGVMLVNSTYYPLAGSAQNLPIAQGGQFDGGYTLLDGSPWNTQVDSRTIGTHGNPIQVNGGGGIDTVYVLGNLSDYVATNNANGVWNLAENRGLDQNADLTGIANVAFQDGSIINLQSDVIKFSEGTVTFLDPSSNFTIEVGTSSLTIFDKKVTGGDHTLVDPTNLQFTDETMNTVWLTEAAALPASEFGALTEMYIGYFGRAPDAGGLDYWASRLSEGMSLSQIAASFSVQPETVAQYPTGLSTQVFVTDIYKNVLGRAPDTGGFNYWVGQLQSGAVSKSTFLLAVINGAQASSGSSADAQYLANKELVGAHFAIVDGLSDIKQAHAVMDVFNGTSVSVTTANNLADSYLATANTAAGSELVVELVGVIPIISHLG